MKAIVVRYAINVWIFEKEKDFQELNSIKCTFGYCITGVEGTIESLYKVQTDITIAYFQAIHEKVIRLTIDENKYIWAVDYFYNNNPNLKNSCRIYL